MAEAAEAEEGDAAMPMRQMGKRDGLQFPKRAVLFRLYWHLKVNFVHSDRPKRVFATDGERQQEKFSH